MAHDAQVKCEKGVVLQESLDNGNFQQTSLLDTLQLKKEIGNARLVSGDAMLWVGQAKLTQRDVDVGAKTAKEFRLEKGKRSFTFTLAMTVESKLFVDELKEQIDGKVGLDVKKKKRKIRKQLSQAMGFTPVNTLKSPMKKPPATPTKLPSSASKSPRLAKPLELSVASVPDAYQSYPSPSPSKSPYRSPFRKKPAPRQSNLPLSPSLTDPRLAASPRVREWLSPVRSIKMKAEFTPPDMKRQIVTTPGSGTSKEGTPVNTEGRLVSKRVRSLQVLLDDAPKDTQHQSTPPKPKPVITSPYFTNIMAKKEPSNESEVKVDQVALSPKVNIYKRDESQSESTDQENTQDVEGKEESAPQSFPKKNIRGLLNLGNYCYMNSIIQAMTTLPDFMLGIQNEDWLHKVIRKKLGDGGTTKSLDQVKSAFDSWTKSDESKPLALHLALEEVLQQIVAGKDAPINPEPIKHVMGKKNSIFATHFQQDAHEFLLNLVNEYEKELANVVACTLDRVKAEAGPPTNLAPKRSSLLNFFRSEPKNDAEPKSPRQNKEKSAAGEEDDLVGQLLPAKCFRAELYRTLTCTSCGYNRKQVERFYDFSLDLPFHAVRDGEVVLAREKPSKKQCYCEVDAAVRNTITERVYYCAKAECSFQEKVATDITIQPSGQHDVVGSTSIPTTDAAPNGSPQKKGQTIALESLMTKQFEPETLELSCEKCKSGKEAVSAYAVKSLPAVMVLHLKRFEVDAKTGSLYKRCDLVEAPPSIRPKYTINGDADSADEPLYELKSVVHHLGRSIDEGHYVADVCEKHDKWVRRNDTHESVISEDYALRASRSQESCYMLFYVRSDASAIEDTDKENLPLARATLPDDADSQNHHQEQSAGSAAGAFL